MRVDVSQGSHWGSQMKSKTTPAGMIGLSLLIKLQAIKLAMASSH